MKSISRTIYVNLTILLNLIVAKSDNLEDLFSNCRISDRENFDECLKFAFNQLNPIFKYGLPEYKVLPFDPHRQTYIAQTRGDPGGLLGYNLVLKDVSEYGWSQSWITKLKYFLTFLEYLLNLLSKLSLLEWIGRTTPWYIRKSFLRNPLTVITNLMRKFSVSR